MNNPVKWSGDVWAQDVLRWYSSDAHSLWNEYQLLLPITAVKQRSADLQISVIPQFHNKSYQHHPTGPRRFATLDVNMQIIMQSLMFGSTFLDLVYLALNCAWITRPNTGTYFLYKIVIYV